MSDGTQILDGARRKDVISNSAFIHLQKLAKSRCSLPEDIKNEMDIHCGDNDKKEDLLSELDNLLSQVDSIKQNKRSIESWQRTKDKILSDFNYTLEIVADKRSIRENPDISEKFWSDYNPNEKKTFFENYYDIKIEVMNAIYLNDPDWLRVVKIFKEVKKDVLTVIEQMAFTPEIKHILKEKINSVKISLPYEIPQTQLINSKCATYMNNAFYNSLNNTFYICIGRIHFAQNEGAFYGIIAHEIAHSINPTSFLGDIFKQTAMSHILKQLYESNATVPCEVWGKQKSDVFVLSSEIYKLPEGLASLDQCLVDKQHLSELNHSSLDYISSIFSDNSIHSYTSNNTFSYLTTSETFKDGLLEKNEFYLEPKLFAESDNGYVEVDYFLEGYFHGPSVFIQEYKCRLLQPDTTEEQAFEEALKETKNLNKIYQYYLSSILGRSSKKLIGFNLSKPSSEDFADWISDKAVELKLEGMLSLEDRRNFILSKSANYCSPGGLEKIAKHKTQIEKEYSMNVHSPNRERYLRNFSSKNAELLKCTPGEDIKKLDRNCDKLIENL